MSNLIIVKISKDIYINLKVKYFIIILYNDIFILKNIHTKFLLVLIGDDQGNDNSIRDVLMEISSASSQANRLTISSQNLIIRLN